jgi:histidine ammonia-lyase
VRFDTRVPGSAERELPDVTVGAAPLAEAEVVAVARHGAQVRFAPNCLDRLSSARAAVDALAAATTPTYGVSTGFGALAVRHIPAERRTQLQRSLIRSHAASSGTEVEAEVVRGMALLRLQTLATGRTGVRPATAQAYLDLLNAGITPIVREYGSLGCSGDLAPLAAVALAVMGEGEVRDRAGALRPAGEVLAEAGLAPIVLAEKEGLALINGTDGMLAMLHLTCADLDLLLRTADLAAAMSLEALLGTDRVLAEELMALRPHPTPSDTSGRWPPVSLLRPSTIPSCWRMAGSRATATSMARRSRTPWISWRSRWPTSPRSVSDAPTGCSTSGDRMGCRPSWPTTRESTPA